MNDLLGDPISPKAHLRMIAEAYNAVPAFDEWVKVLKKKKASFSEWAWQCRLDEMKKLQTRGQNPGEVLKQSALAGWWGLFEVKKKDKPKQEYDFSLARPGESEKQFIERMNQTR